MIELSVENGFIIYTVAALVVVAALGLYEQWRAGVHGWDVSEERLGECAECGLTFLVKRNDTIVRCPRCERLCSTRRR